MAFKFVLIVALVTAVAHGHPSEDDDEYDGFAPSMMYHYEMPLPLPPIPHFPGMPKFPPMPTPPPLLVFGPRNHFRNAHRRIFPAVELPTAEDILSQTAPSHGTFSGVAISSKSVAKVNDDGKIVREGGSTMVLNDNGKLTMEKMGEKPPAVVVVTEPPFPDFPPQFQNFAPPPPPPMFMPPFQPFQPFKGFPSFKPFKPFDPLKFKKFDVESMKNYVPKKGEHVHSVSVSSNSYSNNVNGVKSSGGSVSSMTNQDGDVEEHKVAFKKED